MKSKLFSLCVLVIALSIRAQAILPDTLKFSSETYAKSRQMLFSDPVKRVCLRLVGDSAYPSAVVFGTRIVFLGKDGREVARDTFPESKELKITESAHGEYIYVFGSFGEGRPGGFHRLYNSDGKTILSKEDAIDIGISGLGVPLENQEAFLVGREGRVALVTFDGKMLATKQYLRPENYEDGDIYVASSADETRFYAVINKYKIPEDVDLPILYGYDNNLNELFKDTLECQLAFSPQCSPNGTYLSVKEECESSSNPYWLLNPDGQRLISLESPRTVAFASGSDYFVFVPRDQRPEIFSSANTRASYVPNLPISKFAWVDAAISTNGSLVALYNGGEIALVNTELRSWSQIDFPYAFEGCRYFDNGQTLIFRGEFGFVIYKSIR